MKKLITVLGLSLILIACSKEEIRIVGKPTSYTFSIESINKTRPFNANISWVVDGVTSKDQVKTYGYASAFDLQEGQKFDLIVITTDTLIVRVSSGERELESHSLASGMPYTFKK